MSSSRSRSEGVFDRPPTLATPGSCDSPILPVWMTVRSRQTPGGRSRETRVGARSCTRGCREFYPKLGNSGGEGEVSWSPPRRAPSPRPSDHQRGSSVQRIPGRHEADPCLPPHGPGRTQLRRLPPRTGAGRVPRGERGSTLSGQLGAPGLRVHALETRGRGQPVAGRLESAFDLARRAPAHLPRAWATPPRRGALSRSRQSSTSATRWPAPMSRGCAPSSPTANSVSASSTARTGRPADAPQHLSAGTAMLREMGMKFWLDKSEAAMP